MLTKRIISCLDVLDGKTVKGTKFLNVQDVGDPVELAIRYSNQGIDELIFLDISATLKNKSILINLIEKIAANINIPFGVGGGIKDLESASSLIKAGADKVTINSAAIYNPYLISHLADKFGSQSVVVAMDAKNINGELIIHSHGGTIATKLRLLEWASTAVEYGCGEILFTSMDNDGTKNGFALNELAQLSNTVNVPIIASGGAGKQEHFFDVLQDGISDAALAASVFHYGEITIPSLKKYLYTKGLNVRI